jgi:hypothetical protein
VISSGRYSSTFTFKCKIFPQDALLFRGPKGAAPFLAVHQRHFNGVRGPEALPANTACPHLACLASPARSTRFYFEIKGRCPLGPGGLRWCLEPRHLLGLFKCSGLAAVC